MFIGSGDSIVAVSLNWLLVTSSSQGRHQQTGHWAELFEFGSTGPHCSCPVLTDFKPGTSWFDLATADSGNLTDPRSSPVAVANVVNHGRQAPGTRADIAALLNADGDDHTAYQREWNAVQNRGQSHTAADAEAVQAVAHALTEGIALTLNEAAAAAVSIVNNGHAQDVMLALGRHRGALDLFSTAARTLRGRYRAQMLAVVAFVAHMHGDGVRANVALVVLEAEKVTGTGAPTLAVLVDRAARIPATPDVFLDMAAEYAHRLDEFGATMPITD